VDSFDREIVRFVLLWIPFGGPPFDEVLPRFGFRYTQLSSRFDAIVSTLIANDAATLNSEDKELLAAVHRLSPRYRVMARAGLHEPS
jgi:hypothetical protein